MSEKMPTQFASAERASEEQVKGQSKAVLAMPMLKQLLNAVPDVLMILNGQRQIIFANQSLLNMLGCSSPRDVLGKRSGEMLNCIHAKESAGGCGTTMACRNCGAILAILSSQRGSESTRECRIAREGGDGLNLRVHATPFAIGQSELTIFSISDISSEKRRKVLERMLFEDIVQDANELRDKVAAREETEGDEENRDGYMEGLRRDVEHFSRDLTEEINEHRILMAAENGELCAHPLPCDGLHLLERVAFSLQERELANKHYIEVDKNARSIDMVIDQTLLKQVLAHMIRNAFEACEEDEKVRVGVYMQNAGVEFRVCNAAYINEKQQTQIFQRDFSTKGEGRGIGTYSMRLLCEKYLQGKVSFTSSLRLGTVFSVVVPRYAFE